MSFDISSIVAQGTEVVIRHPSTGEPIGLTITIRPDTHPEVVKVERMHTNENLRNRGKALTAQKLEARILDRLAAHTEDWKFEGDITISGEQPQCNAVNARKLYKDAPWIKNQVAEAVGEDARFYTGADGGSV